MADEHAERVLAASRIIALTTDPRASAALRTALESRCRELTVWNDGIEAGTERLASMRETPLLIADLEHARYPAGTIHRLAEHVATGTPIVALGTDPSASAAREALQCGIGHYLVKPLTTQDLLDALLDVCTQERSTAHAHTGHIIALGAAPGAGATTVAAALALHLTAQGRHIVLADLDENATGATLSLDVSPPAGLDQLVAGTSPPSASEIAALRIEHPAYPRLSLYGYRPGTPVERPDPQIVAAIVRTLAQSSHTLIVDGVTPGPLADAVLSTAHTVLFVVEPTFEHAPIAARALRAYTAPHIVIVVNHARERRTLSAGAPEAQITIPFDTALTTRATLGWANTELPHSTERAITALVHALAPAQH